MAHFLDRRSTYTGKLEFNSPMRLKSISCIMTGAVIFCAVLVAQSGSSTRDGVYTGTQADEGQKVYTQKCAMCHGVTLAGNGQNPPLAGDQFMQNWTGADAG